MESLGSWKRTHMCGEISLAEAGTEVTLTGWVNRRRDHGGLIFIDLRDRSGIIQLVLSPDNSEAAFRQAEQVRNEYVIAARGMVRKRPPGTENPNLKTGEVEVYCSELKVLSASHTPPFYIQDGIDVDESLRLRYRYLDLRRPEMLRGLELRHRVTMAVRSFLDQKGFIEVETPMLTRSTPEGARDYLVPSRVHPGHFYALPQSPQLFKQLLMVAGVDRYFQVARCFRDEDLRADRQPEFTQLDLEMSFVRKEDVMELVEELIEFVFQETLGVKIATPFPVLSYEEAVSRFGTDKPHTGFGMEIVDISPLVGNSEFNVFRRVLEAGGRVKGLNIAGGSSFSRKEIDDLVARATALGAKGLAWMIVAEDGIRSPIAKFFAPETVEEMIRALGARPGDMMVFVADTPAKASEILGALRLDLAQELGLLDPKTFNFVWVTLFPLLEWDEEESRLVAVHHPFTAPVEEDVFRLRDNPLSVKAQSYDLVLNGTELGGGSIRIHDPGLQRMMFKLLGIDEAMAEEQFGFLLEAFEYGAPPHGGIALGLDRLVMLMAGRSTIRDVIAFPKTQSAACLLTRAPQPARESQLRELHLSTVTPKERKPSGVSRSR